MTKALIAAMAMAVVSTGAMAGMKSDRGPGQPDWATIDLDKDNIITPQEAQKYQESKAAAAKDAQSKDKDS